MTNTIVLESALAELRIRQQAIGQAIAGLERVIAAEQPQPAKTPAAASPVRREPWKTQPTAAPSAAKADSSWDDKILRVLAAAKAPMSAKAVVDQLPGSIYSTIWPALRSLVRRGLAVQLGQTYRALSPAKVAPAAKGLAADVVWSGQKDDPPLSGPRAQKSV